MTLSGKSGRSGRSDRSGKNHMTWGNRWSQIKDNVSRWTKLVRKEKPKQKKEGE